MQSVLRSFRVLEAVAESQPAGVNALARQLELPTSTVQRILATLGEAGWIAPTDERLTRWKLTSRALAVGYRALPQQNLLEAAAGPMHRLRDATQETIHLSIPEQLERMVIVERVDCEQAVRAYAPFGGSSHMHASASGRAVLAALPDAALSDVIARGLPRMTEKTVTDPVRLRELVNQARIQGFATSAGENRPDVCAVAAAVVSMAGRPVAAVAISVPSLRFSDETAELLGPMVVQTATDIGVRLSS